jgi:hypothetical protein
MDTIDTNRPRKYEFLVLVGIIGILALVLLGALDRIRGEFEEAAMQSEAAAIRVELLDRLAHREAVGGELPGSDNPLRWIARQPAGYVGELDTPPEQGGVWYLDRRRDELAYRFRSGREARFRLVRGRDAANVQGGLAGVGLRRVDGEDDESGGNE